MLYNYEFSANENKTSFKDSKNYKIIVTYNNKDYIDLCSNLLYKVYMEEQNWEPDPDNPNQINIIEHPVYGKSLTDQYTYTSFWAIAFYKDQVVGCLRGTLKDEHGFLPTQHYPSFRKTQCFIDVKNCFRGSNVLEVARFAVLPEFRTSGISIALLKIVAELAYNYDLSIFATTISSVAPLAKQCGLKEQKTRFKYEENDKSFVYTFLSDYTKGEVAEILESIKNTMVSEKLLEVKNIVEDEVYDMLKIGFSKSFRFL